MYKDGVLTIGDFQKGQVRYPIYGFGLLQNIEVFENKGIARLKNRLTDRGNITPTQLPIAEVYDVYGNTYTLTGETGSGTVYKNGVSLQSGLNNAWDIKIYKDYLFVRNANVMSCYGPLNTSPQWFSNVTTGFSQVYRGALLIGQDDFLYTGNGNFVAKIEVTGAGTPAIAPTCTIVTQLDLPDGQYVSCLEEFGTKIAIGTHGGANYYDRVNYATARLYTWNRQAGTLGNFGLADLPVIFTENGINAIKQHANKLYISAGTQGNMYISDGTNYQKITTFPYSENGFDYSSTVYPNAIEISSRGTLLVGVSGDLNPVSRPAIYEVDINTEGYPVVPFTTSVYNVGTVNSPTVYKIGFVNNKSRQQMNVGYSSGANFYVDTSDFRMYPNYGGVIESQLVKVGVYNNKRTFEHIEWCLAEPLVSGQNIRISYRRNNKEAYTLINTWGFNTLGNIISFEDVAGIADCEYIQLKIELDQAISTIYGSNINLTSVRLW